MTASRRVPGAGDSITLGDTLALSFEPGERWARVVGIRRDIPDSIRKFVVREFQPDDGWFPTGGYRTTSTMAMSPWLR